MASAPQTHATEHFTGFGSGATTAAASPAASTYNLTLSVEPGLEDGEQIAMPESRVLIIMTGNHLFIRSGLWCPDSINFGNRRNYMHAQE